jgi:hypothetical protein
MKKIVLCILSCIFAFSLFAAPGNPYEIFTVEPSAACVKAGSVLELGFNVKSKDGYALNGISASVQRRSAPAAFFNTKGVKVKFYHKDPAKKSPYDTVRFFNNVFKKSISDGNCTLQLNTAGMQPGDYAVAMLGYFTKKGAKPLYRSIYLALTVEAVGNQSEAK